MAATSAPSSDGLRRFTRQWLLILTLGVLGVAAALGFAAFQHKRYTATASVSFNDTSQDVSLLGSVPTVNPYPTALANAAADTITSTQVLTRVQRQLRGAQNRRHQRFVVPGRVIQIEHSRHRSRRRRIDAA